MEHLRNLFSHYARVLIFDTETTRPDLQRKVFPGRN